MNTISHKFVHHIYSWSYCKDVVDRFYNWTKEQGSFKVWKDDRKGITGHLNNDMAAAVQKSRLVVAFLSDAYFQSRNCYKEINYADTLEKEILIVKLQKNFIWLLLTNSLLRLTSMRMKTSSLTIL